MQIDVTTARQFIMKIEFIKNIQFTKLVKADGRLREFNFRKVNGKNEGRFTVDVGDDRGNRIIFNMRKTEGGWELITGDPLPTWITENGPIFHDLIEEELQKG
ncbi:MAG: hypothetical protein JWQ96_2684 [Segetibacter sp.]|nr:hypothetical protein [Segetibacter sp.]